MNKKLQIFVSSTYKDLIEERQAAVKAILDAGHIPAGMELFKPGNLSQLQTIYKWIDDSDVYILILGGRYGSIEPYSGKSYTQLEYEYAMSKNIPFFAVVLSDSYLLNKATILGKMIYESNNIPLYEKFKQLVLTKTIRFVEDEKDIQIAILATIQTFKDDYHLTGWIRASKDIDELEQKFDDLNCKYNTLLKNANKQRNILQKIQSLVNQS